MRKYMFLLLILALLALCLFGCGRRDKQDAQDTAPVEEGAPAENNILAADEDVSFLEYCDGNITLRFSLEADGVWHWVDEPTFPLDGEKVVELLTALRELSSLPELPLPEDLDLCGLAEARKYITLDSEAMEGTVYIGDQAEDGTWYMMLDGADHMHMISDEFMQLLSRSVYDMALLPSFPTFEEDRLISVTVADSERRASLRRVDGEWKGSSAQISDRADEVMNALAALQVSRCFDFLPSAQALQLTGFSTPTATITIEYRNSVDVDSSFTLTLGALRSAEEGYYATFSGDDTIYLLPSTQVSSLLVLLIYGK